MEWNKELAYIVGLISTDGNLSSDGRHIELTSKDLEQIENFIKLLNLKNKIGTKQGTYNPGKIYYRVQFGNVKFYRFLVKIGLTANKTKTIGKLKIPKRFFADFLRGHLDGDGYTYSFWDSRWKNSFRFYSAFLSASKKHLEWLKKEINDLYKIKGIIRFKGKSTYELQFAKKSSINLMNKIYYRNDLVCLSRKHSKIKSALSIITKQADVL